MSEKHFCPICRKKVKKIAIEEADNNRFSPFCSERCKLIDLGAWLDTDYKILSKQPEELESRASDDSHLAGFKNQ